MPGTKYSVGRVVLGAAASWYELAQRLWLPRSCESHGRWWGSRVGLCDVVVDEALVGPRGEWPMNPVPVCKTQDMHARTARNMLPVSRRSSRGWRRQRPFMLPNNAATVLAACWRPTTTMRRSRAPSPQTPTVLRRKAISLETRGQKLSTTNYLIGLSIPELLPR